MPCFRVLKEKSECRINPWTRPAVADRSVKKNGPQEHQFQRGKEIIQYTSVVFTQALIRVCLDGTIIDSSTTLVTMYYCGYVGV